MIKVAVLGYGTVGSGVVEVLQDNRELIAGRLGEDIEVKYILDLRDFPGDKNESLVVHDVKTIMDDPEVDIVCETMGGVGAAYEFTKSALTAGKSVCTSNKELVEKHGAELLKLASENGCNYQFEASVGGGIPIIRVINTSLAPERIDSIKGILNGTTNYILTKMADEGADYDSVLKQAQDLGYAERNPEADVEGHDAGRKIAILASLMTGKDVAYDDIYIEGITAVEPVDFKFADRLGRRIKLLARADRNDDVAITAFVAPHMIPKDHPLGGVNDVFNAVLVTGNMLGDAMFYGKGAGKLATASAVVSDVIDLGRAKLAGISLPCVWSEDKAVLRAHDEKKESFFVRTASADADKLASVIPGATKVADADGQTGYVIDDISEKELNGAIERSGVCVRKIRLA